LQQNPLQEVQGQLFGMSQSHANKWIHLLHPVLNGALAHQDLLPESLWRCSRRMRRTAAPPPPFVA
jgi:hypothetical protein